MAHFQIGCVINQIDWLCGISSKRMANASKPASGWNLLAGTPESPCVQVHVFLFGIPMGIVTPCAQVV